MTKSLVAMLIFVVVALPLIIFVVALKMDAPILGIFMVGNYFGDLVFLSAIGYMVVRKIMKVRYDLNLPSAQEIRSELKEFAP